MRSKLFLIIVSLLLIIVMIVFIVMPKNDEYEKVNIDATISSVLDDIEKTKSYINKTSEWSGDNADIGYFSPNLKSDKSINPKREVIDLFLTGLVTENIGIFMSSFDPQVISQDLFKAEENDKGKVAEEIINEISRNEKVIDIEFKEKKGAFDSNTNDISLKLYYKDGKKTDFLLNLRSFKDLEFGHTAFVIETSAWDIIDQVNNNLQ